MNRFQTFSLYHPKWSKYFNCQFCLKSLLVYFSHLNHLSLTFLQRCSLLSARYYFRKNTARGHLLPGRNICGCFSGLERLVRLFLFLQEGSLQQLCCCSCCLGCGRGFCMNATPPDPALTLEMLFWCNLSLRPASVQITSGTFCFQCSTLV